MKNSSETVIKFITKAVLIILLFVCFQLAFSQDILRDKTCPKGLYPNGDNCYPCLGCHPCPGPNGTIEYCSNTNALHPRDASADGFLQGYSFSDGKMISNKQLPLKQGGTFLFQITAINSNTGEIVFPNFMPGVKLEVIRKNQIISTGTIDQTGRVQLTLGAGDIIRMLGIKNGKVSRSSFVINLPVENALRDLMENSQLIRLKLEIVAFNPTEGIPVNYNDFKLADLSSVGLTSSNLRAVICDPDAVACSCGTNICGKDKDACCRICDYLKDGTYSEGCPKTITILKGRTNSTKPRN